MAVVVPDFEHCYRAVLSRDSRFDGWFVTAVRTTGIYCRPSCPAMTPKRTNLSFHPSAAAAQQAGYRACKRCRPDATPGSPDWNYRGDVVGRAMRLISDGVVDREGVTGLARRLGYSSRQLNRLLVGELGAPPLALARSGRAQAARILIETTELSFTEVAFAAGFSSVRQFNDTVREIFASSPTELRGKAKRTGASTPGTIVLRLPFRVPLRADALIAFLVARAVPGVEEGADGVFRRTLRLPHAPAIVELEAANDHVRCLLRLDDWRDLAAAVQRCRRMLDLDADPVAVDDQLGADPMLGPLVAKAPGLRVPGHVDGSELAIRAVLGQQVSVAGARSLAGRLVARFGKPLTSPSGGLTHLFPEAGAIADADPSDLPMPASRRRALRGLALALDTGRIVIDPGSSRSEVQRELLELPGIGPWTAAYTIMRGLGDPDVFLPGDLGVRRALRHLDGHSDAPGGARCAAAWRPWRSYAVIHLWHSLPDTNSTETHSSDKETP